MKQFVKCLECGKEFQVLIKHIICKHNMSIDVYKVKYPGCKFESKEVTLRRWNSTKKAIKKKYGVDNIMHNEVSKNKAEYNMHKTFLSKYGVIHPMQSKHVKQLYQSSLMKKYGRKCVMQVKNIQQKQRKSYSKTCMDKYGVDNTFAVKEVQTKARIYTQPNGIESLLIREFPELVYVGNGRMWIQFKDTTRKNPDFIIKDSNKVIEVFGEYWHSKVKTGVNKKSHQRDILFKYQQVGYDCLIIWENEINNNFDNVKIKISSFLKNCSSETTRRTPQIIVDEDIVQTNEKSLESNRNIRPLVN